MNRPDLLLLGIIGLTATAGTASADDQAIGLKAGALGLGVEYTRQFSERLAFRAGLNGSRLGFDSVESGIDYAFDLVWDSVSLGVDFHPTRKPLRLSLGLLRNDNRLEAAARLSGSVDIGGTSYTPAEVGALSARVGFGSTAPFAGIGWDWSRNARRIGVSFDLGVVSQGNPEVTLTATGTLSSDPAFQADMATEAAELQADLDGFDLMPYATLGLVFRF